MERAGWRCERAGCSALAVEIHHRDHDRSNNAPGNLEALCFLDHRREHDRLRGQPRASRGRDLIRELL